MNEIGRDRGMQKCHPFQTVAITSAVDSLQFTSQRTISRYLCSVKEMVPRGSSWKKTVARPGLNHKAILASRANEVNLRFLPSWGKFRAGTSPEHEELPCISAQSYSSRPRNPSRFICPSSRLPLSFLHYRPRLLSRTASSSLSRSLVSLLLRCTVFSWAVRLHNEFQCTSSVIEALKFS